MHINHLQLLGVQRWQLKVPSTRLDEKKEIQVDHHTEISDLKVNAVEGVSFYAAASLRDQQRWLWVVEQDSLSIDEVRLLDKILSATGSDWENFGIADSYVDYKFLQQELNRDITAVILMSKSDHKNIFRGQNVINTFQLTELMNDQLKKKKLWTDLKNLIEFSDQNC